MDSRTEYTGRAGRTPTVLFSPKPLLEPKIRRSLVDFTPTFERLDAPGLDMDAYDIVVPLSLDWECWVNRSAPEALRRKAFVPPDDVIALCDNKVAFARFMRANGLGDFVPAVVGAQEYPYVLKRRHDVWGQHTRVIPDRTAEAACLKSLEPGDWFRQQFIPGSYEYATHMLVANRQIVFACTMEYRFSSDSHVHSYREAPARRAWVDHSHFYHLFARVLGAMDYEGFCCVDYKLLRGAPKIFEINPRMGGSLAFSANAAMKSYLNAVTRRAGALKKDLCPA